MPLAVTRVTLGLVLKRSGLSSLLFSCVPPSCRSSTAVSTSPPAPVPHVHRPLRGDRCVRDLLLVLPGLHETQLEVFRQLVGKSRSCFTWRTTSTSLSPLVPPQSGHKLGLGLGSRVDVAGLPHGGLLHPALATTLLALNLSPLLVGLNLKIGG